MKKIYLYCATVAMLVAIASCLQDKGYTDIINGVGSNNVIISWFGNDGTPNNRALVLPSGKKDTVDYPTTISITSARKLNKDFLVTIAVDASVIDAVNSTITKPGDKFSILPDSTYHIASFTTIVTKDTTEAPLFITFYKSKIDKSKNYMLPLRILDQEGAIVATNMNLLKLTLIGNPLAGAWNWEYIRYNNQDGSGSPSTDDTDVTVFAPLDGTSLNVPTGYYTGPNYIISFANTGGVLSDFKAVIDPKQVESDFTANGIKIVDGPNITVNSDYTKITVNYVVLNSTPAYRNITDIFYK